MTLPAASAGVPPVDRSRKVGFRSWLEIMLRKTLCSSSAEELHGEYNKLPDVVDRPGRILDKPTGVSGDGFLSSSRRSFAAVYLKTQVHVPQPQMPGWLPGMSRLPYSVCMTASGRLAQDVPQEQILPWDAKRSAPGVHWRKSGRAAGGLRKGSGNRPGKVPPSLPFPIGPLPC